MASSSTTNSNSNSNLQELEKKFNVTIYENLNTNHIDHTNNAPIITVFLPGTLIPLRKYQSTIDCILATTSVVIGFNLLNPLFSSLSLLGGRTHVQMTQDVMNVVNEYTKIQGDYQQQEQQQSDQRRKVNIIGHSLGGKIALLVASGKYGSFLNTIKFDTIIALDPVDDRPRELTSVANAKEVDDDIETTTTTTTTTSNSQQQRRRRYYVTDLSYRCNAKQIYLYQSELGGNGMIPLCPSGRNATIIQNCYPNQITAFEILPDSGHMSFIDTYNDISSEQARATIQSKIKEVLCHNTTSTTY